MLTSLLITTLLIIGVTPEPVEECKSNRHMIFQLTKWITSYGGFINKKRIEVRSSVEGGNGVFLRKCSECLRGGKIFPMFRYMTIPDKGNDNALMSHQESDEEYPLYHDIYGIDPILMILPYDIHMTPFSPLNSHGTLSVINKIQGSKGFESSNANFEKLLILSIALELKNVTSQWKPYFDSFLLPLPRFGVRLNKDELSVLDLAGDRLSVVSNIRYYINKYLHHLNRGEGDVTDDEILQAASLSNSRTFGENPSYLINVPQSYHHLENLPVMIPFLDLVNHRDMPSLSNRYYNDVIGVISLRYKASCGSTPRVDRRNLHSISKNDYSISPGDELFNSYHENDRGNDLMFGQYGFIVPVSFSSPTCQNVADLYLNVSYHLKLSDPHQNLTYDVNLIPSPTEEGMIEILKYIMEIERLIIVSPSSIILGYLHETLRISETMRDIIKVMIDCPTPPVLDSS